MIIQFLIFFIDTLLVNLALICAFLLRTAGNIPPDSIAPYKSNYLIMTLIYMLAFTSARVFKKRFRSFVELLKRILLGMFMGTLFNIALVYAFRAHWSRFPTSIFILSFPIAVLLIYVTNYYVLKHFGRICKRVVVIGGEKTEKFLGESKLIEKIYVEVIEDLTKCHDIDEIIIREKIHGEKSFNLMIYLLQKLKTDVYFVPEVYGELLSDNFNGNGAGHFLATFLGRKSDIEEFMIRTLDVICSVIMLVTFLPLMFIIAGLIKMFSDGPVFYLQERAGKDAKIFRLYKFRTMISKAGLHPASVDDPRITPIGRILRKTRLDELPQLVNVLVGQMSLVGPRPENLARVEAHKALQGIRLAVKPGITGLAQIRSLYDLHPTHKIKYDYLYIQKRSLLLNIFILIRTIPVVLSKKGW